MRMIFKKLETYDFETDRGLHIFFFLGITISILSSPLQSFAQLACTSVSRATEDHYS